MELYDIAYMICSVQTAFNAGPRPVYVDKKKYYIHVFMDNLLYHYNHL
jgi:hypothetical protein